MVERLLCLGLLAGLMILASVRIVSASGQSTAQSALPEAPQATVLPQPDARGIYHVGDGVSSPKLIFQVEPEFTEASRKKKISGKSTVSAVVGADGLVKEVETTRSIADTVSPKLRGIALGLDEEARKAVRQYRFDPGQYRGKAVPVRLKIDVDFEIF